MTFNVNSVSLCSRGRGVPDSEFKHHIAVPTPQYYGCGPYFCFNSCASPHCAQGLLLVRLQGPYMVSGIKPGWVVCKGVLSTLLSLSIPYGPLYKGEGGEWVAGAIVRLIGHFEFNPLWFDPRAHQVGLSATRSDS